MLRLLIPALTPIAFTASLASAQTTSLPTHETHGELIDRALERAKTDGADLHARIELLQKKFNLPEGVATDALSRMDNARVRELLGITDEFLAENVAPEGRYEGGLFVFASFSMPPLALKQLFRDASDLNIPVIFNGFVDNSVIATEAKVRAVYEEGDTTKGFLIDPTLFTRFNVEAVPTVVTTATLLDVCESTDCGEDATPPHDRVSGNVPLRYLLGVLAGGNTGNAEPVKRVLGMIE